METSSDLQSSRRLVGNPRSVCPSLFFVPLLLTPFPGAAFLTQTVALDDQTNIKFEIWDTVRLPRL